MDEKVYSVSEATVAIKEALEEYIGNIWIKGEISNFSCPASGHVYFTLKDEQNQIRVALFNGKKKIEKIDLKDGQKIMVSGRVTIYSKRSEYQLIAKEIQILGVGELLVEFHKLKEKLEKEGLFNEEHKQDIPEFPSRIAIITSKTGAAVRDIINVISRRYTGTELLIYPVMVQGDEAPPQIVKALDDLNSISGFDLIILTRGGGSLEDLWAFNDEEVARAVFRSKIPVISAVGHQVDFTIVDFVADLRAPTPSAAAEIAVPDSAELIKQFNSKKDRMAKALARCVKNGEERLNALAGSYAFKMPFEIFNDYVQNLDGLEERLKSVMDTMLLDSGDNLKVLEDKLKILNPLSVLKKGYSVVYDNKTGKIIKDASTLEKGGNVRIKMYKGSAKAEIKEKNKE